MKEKSFKRWLKSIKKYKTSTINTKIDNCKTIEKYYDDLDKLYERDKLNEVKEELENSNHKSSIEEVHKVDTSRYLSSLKLYLEFKDNIVLDRIKTDPDMNPDKHDGSYELVREAVESLSRMDIEKLDRNDLDMLYAMAVGSWSMGIDIKREKIDNSNLPIDEKTRMKSIFKEVKRKTENGKYGNMESDKPSIGMFGTGFHTFAKSSNDETARKFISLLVNIKDLDNEEEVLSVSEKSFKEDLDGIQAGSASMMLHPFKPTIFPILTGIVRESIVVLEGEDVVLNQANRLTYYIENTRKLKKFRDEKCNFKNYRVLDLALRDVEKLMSNSLEVKNSWFVNSVIGSKDCTEDFIEKGIWENTNKEYRKVVNAVKINDNIVLKSTYTRKNGLPFFTNNLHVPTMLIKAIGTVKSNPKNGRILYVEWEKINKIKEWYFFAISETILKVERKNDWINDALLDFTFNNKLQNIESFKNHPKWINEYGDKSEKLDLSIDFNKTIDFDNLYFTDEKTLKSQISIALKSGKSIILIGPPGAGKSKIASKIVESYGVHSKMVTAMSDWSSYDTIGGYKPDEDGKLYFEEGIFLSSFKTDDQQDKNQWLIIDEINRADIDKAFGPFFSALSGDDVELGLRDSQGRNIKILLEENLSSKIKDYETAENEYIIPKDWRIIATMNTFDKTSLYEMSYAFMRRFAFIPVAIPSNIDDELVGQFLELWNIDLSQKEYIEIAKLWNTINRYRKVGPAIIEDIGNYIKNGGDYTSAIVIYILPQLEGMFESDISRFVEDLKEHYFIGAEDRLVESVEDFFNIKNLRLEGK